MKKALMVAFVLILGLIIVLVAARNFIVKTAVTKGIQALAGVKVDIQKIDIGLMSPTIEIDSLKVYNPPGFADSLMADIPLIYVEYDLGGFLKNRVHLNKIKIEVGELSVVLNEQGKLNLNSFALVAPKSAAPSAPEPRTPSSAKLPEVKIDELYLKIGKVGYKGYFPVVGTNTMEFNPNIEETFKEVTNPSAVAGDVLKKILSRIGISDFADFDIAGQVATLKQSANEALSRSAEAAKTSAKEAESSARESLDKTKQDLKNIFSR